MRPVAWSKLAACALLALCYGAAPTASGRKVEDPPDLAQGSYSCLGGAAQGNINELNMSSANGNANFLEIKVFDANLPTDARFCYTERQNNGLTSTCQTLGSAAIDVYRNTVKIGTGDTTAFAAGDYLVLELPNGTTEVNEAMLLTAAGAVIDHIQYCAGDCKTATVDTAYWTTPSACGVQLDNVKNQVKDVARYPDGTGDWTSDTADNSPLDKDGSKGRTNGGLGPHHLELQHATGSGITCGTSVLTIKACADSACSSAYTGSVVSGSVTGGAGATGFAIAANASSTTINFQPVAGTATLGASGAPNATTCNFGSPSCTFTGTSVGFLFSDTRTGANYAIPPHTAGAANTTSYYLRAVQASTTNAAVCTPAIANSIAAVTISYACNNPSSCQGDTLLTLNNGATNAAVIARTGSAVNFNFDANGAAPVTFLYEDVGLITVAASKTFTPTGGVAPVTLSGLTTPFVVKPHHFTLSNITCAGTNNPGATTGLGGMFCRAGANFSVTAAAFTANVIPTMAKNYGKESPTPASIKLTANLLGGLGLVANPGLSGALGAVATTGSADGTATGAAFSWNEVGIITLTPSVGDGNYLGAGDVTGTAATVGRFVPDHYDTAVTTPPVFAYSGQPFAVTVTARLATPTAGAPLTAASANYNAAGFPRTVTLSALALDGTPLAAGLGGFAINTNVIQPANFAAAVGNGAPVYTFAVTPTAPTTIRLHAHDPDGVDSALIEGNIEIRSGRLRLSNAFGSARANLSIPVSAQYWSGNSWILNTDDNFTTIPRTSVALSPANDLRGVTVNSDVTLGADPALGPGRGFIVLTQPAAGPLSVDLAVNLGGAWPDQSCLPAHPVIVGAAAAAEPWLRSRYGGCSAAFNSDPSARGTFGVYPPESRRVIHIRESFN